VIPKICPTVCLELIQDAVALDPSLEKEGQLLSACFEEIQEKEDLLRAITLKIRSCQKS
jgi:hypothetical protein